MPALPQGAEARGLLALMLSHDARRETRLNAAGELVLLDQQDRTRFVFMEPTSPKGKDLRRDGRYTLHCAVSDTSGASGEFSVSGQAQFIDNPELRALAVRLAPYSPAEG